MGSHKTKSPPPWFPLFDCCNGVSPPSANDKDMLQYLTRSVGEVEGRYPGCGIIIAGDFNKLDIKSFCRLFRFKQLIKTPTRGAAILDLVITKLHKFYHASSIEILPPFGLSDHNTIVIPPQGRSHKQPDRVIYKRDTRPSRKKELGRYLNNVDWSILDSADTCEFFPVSCLQE